MDTDGIKLDSNAEWGFYFRVTLKNEKNIREAKGVKVLASSKGSGFQFYTTELDGLNGEYKELLQTYEASQAHLTKLVVNTCGTIFIYNWKESIHGFSRLCASTAQPFAENRCSGRANDVCRGGH